MNTVQSEWLSFLSFIHVCNILITDILCYNISLLNVYLGANLKDKRTTDLTTFNPGTLSSGETIDKGILKIFYWDSVTFLFSFFGIFVIFVVVVFFVCFKFVHYSVFKTLVPHKCYLITKQWQIWIYLCFMTQNPKKL